MREPMVSSSTRLTIVGAAAVDIVLLGVLFLQLTEFPEDLSSLRSQLNSELLDEAWFPWLVVGSAFPALGAIGAIGVWRWALWTYCTFLVGCIGETPTAMSHHSSSRACAHRPASVCTGLRMYFVYQTSYKEGLEPRNPLLRDMLLLSGAVFFQVYIFRLSSRTALEAQLGAASTDRPRARRSSTG